MTRWRAVLGLVIAALASACGETASPAPRDLDLDVVLVVLDSVGAEHVGAYGRAPSPTPRLDALAAGGVLFERAYAASSTPSQSLSALWTGRLPTRGGAIGLAEATPHPELDTFPAALRRAGFDTAFFSNRSYRRDRRVTDGFDEFAIDSVPGRWDANVLTDKALGFLDRAGETTPFLLVVDYADAGEPHRPSSQWRAAIDVPAVDTPLSLPTLRADAEARRAAPDDPAFADLVARYEAEVLAVDAALGRLLDGLAARDLDRDTLVILTSSQGVEFLEHGYVGHSWTLYDEVVAVPLILWAPGRLAPGRVAEPVSLVDVFPTLNAALRLPTPPLALDGMSLLEPEGDGWRAGTERSEVLVELVIPEACIARAVIAGHEKLIASQRTIAPEGRQAVADAYPQIVAGMAAGDLERPPLFGPPVKSELFGLRADPGERTDLSATSPERLRALAAALARYADQCTADGLVPGAARPPAKAPEPGDLDQLDELRQLGYL